MFLLLGFILGFAPMTNWFGNDGAAMWISVNAIVFHYIMRVE